MEMNQFYNPGAVQHIGGYSQQYPTYNSWTSEYAKNVQNYNNSVMFGDNFNNCLDQSNDFCQYNQVPQTNNMNQSDAVPLQNQNPVSPNKANMQKSDLEDSPALRALLSNPVKKIKYTPNYYSNITQPNKSDKYKDNQIKESLTSVECATKTTTAVPTRNQLTPILDAAVLSPQSSEPEYHADYLNYPGISRSTPKDGFTSPSMSTTPSILSEITAGSPFEISPPPSASSVASTISNSPPPSPIGQKFALSSQNMTPSSWLPSGTGPQAPISTLGQQLWMPTKNADSYLGEEKQGSKRSRQTYSRSQTHMLELSFFKSTYLSRQRRSELSKELNLTERQIKIWFQNRRMKEKKVKGTPAERKSPPQQQFMPQPALGYAAKSPNSTTAVTATYQTTAGFQAHPNSLGVPRSQISHNMPGQPAFNTVPSAPVSGQFMQASYDAFSKRNPLPTGMEHQFSQQPFGANQYPQFPYPQQNSHNYLAPTCNYGQYSMRPRNMPSSADFPMVAPNVFAG